MATSERLSEQQRRELHDRLVAMYDDVIDRISGELQSSDDRQLQEIGGRVRDAGEDSVADLLSDLNLTQYRHLVEEANDVERALADMRAGSYGQCEECGRFIGYERLKATPTARRCLECQQRIERDYPPTGAGATL